MDTFQLEAILNENNPTQVFQQLLRNQPLKIQRPKEGFGRDISSNESIILPSNHSSDHRNEDEYYH